MNPIAMLIAFMTIVIKEITRFTRIWQQTLVPPAISTLLYFVIFGNLIGPRIGQMDGFDYMDFLVPGLILMSVITASYQNVVSSFFGTALCCRGLSFRPLFLLSLFMMCHLCPRSCCCPSLVSVAFFAP